MTESEIKTPCDECGEKFNPYLNRKKGWTCPNCKTRQPNMALHYRIITYLCGAALAFTAFGVVGGLIPSSNPESVHWLPLVQSALLLLAMSLITFKSQPWNSNGLTALLCLTFFSFLFCYLIGPTILIFALDVTTDQKTLTVLGILGVLIVSAGVYLSWVYLSVRRLQRASGS